MAVAILLGTAATLVGAVLVTVPVSLLGYGLYAVAWWGIWRVAPG